MKRFVTYLYLYDGRMKGNNAGFIKVEINGEKSAFLVQIKNLGKYSGKGKVYLVYEAEAVIEAGAGDSFWGGFMSQFVKSKLNPEDCSMEELKKFARYGNAVASLCIEKKGGILSIPEEKETSKRLQLSV